MVGLLCGCESGTPSPAIERAGTQLNVEARDRMRSMGWVLTDIYEREATAPNRLKYAFEWALKDAAHDAQQLETNLGWAVKDFEWQVERFGNNLPVYGDKAIEIIWAKPETIPWTAILLFY
jgi:hypothetical protein